MPLSDWMSVTACTGHLALAVVVLLRGSGSPLRFPLVLLNVSLFVWGFAQWAYRMSEEPLWDWLETTSSPLHPPLMLWFTVRFVGRFRQLKPFLIAFFCGWGGMAVVSAASLLVPELDAWIQREQWWSHAYLVGLVPTVAATIVLLAQHLRQVTALEEQVSTRLLLAAVLVGNLLGATELWANGRTEESTFLQGGGLGNVGTLAATVLLAIVVLRYRLFQNRPTSLVPLYALTVGLLGVLGYLAVFSLLRADLALLIFGTTIVTFVLAIAARDLFTTTTSVRERTRHLATLGRFSAQLAHDVRNPLSALKGSLQFLLEEREQGRSIDSRRDFLELSMEQIARIEALIVKYQRLGAVAPDSMPVDLNNLILSVWSGVQSARDVAGIQEERKLQDNLPSCCADSDLLGVALQNVILNALDAMPGGGTLTLRSFSHGNNTVVEVADTGTGMDYRDREQVFDDFFTTKTDGSGLGLGFVKRVVQAHGGNLDLDSQKGLGTTVRLELPHAGVCE
jgi:signal transduction histidine kinase